MSKSHNFFSIFIPGATVFISSFCIMVLELVAARLIARHLGSSLYTWTAVIGIVLAGITIGNYLGGRIADRFNAKRTLAVLFAFASASCVVTVILNNLVGQWLWLWQFSWPMRVFTHVSLVFLLPSTLLGMISPVVAKMALDKGLPTGRTVGDIYACGAAGSIAGTFATGYYLILALGTIEIVWAVGGVLLLLAILFWLRGWVLYLWAAVFAALMTMGLSDADWTDRVGAGLALRERPNPNVIYEDESPYCYIAVERISKNPDRRAFMQDKLMHSDLVIGDILDLKYPYEQIYAAVTRLLSRGKNKLSVLVIGGGGYVFPRYVEKIWPGSRIDVVEIDPGVTEAAMQAFGLGRDTTINTFTMDARNYVNQLLERQQTQGQQIKYDFIYEDALCDYSVPYQLTTKEFNDRIARILTDNGVYMVELIDIFDVGFFIGAFISTLEETFRHVYVVTEDELRSARNVYVLIAANRQINLENLSMEKAAENLDLWILNDSEIESLKNKAKGIVLTDNYAPVENLLAPVVLESSIDLLSEEYLNQAEQLEREGKWEQSISKYKDVIRVDPRLSIKAYNEIGMILAGRGEFREAVEAFKGAVEYNRKAEEKQSVSNINYNIGIALQRLDDGESTAYLQKAIQGYEEDLARKPNSVKTVSRLGNAVASVGDFDKAIKYFQQAVDMNPNDAQNHSMLAQALVMQGQFDEAITGLKKAVAFMLRIGNEEDAAKLQENLERIELKKFKQEE
jgi:tetratricopeptide (TPR) repeat protein/MFS family permease